MIVKNEAHVICRCLDSVRPYISTWVIVDTGSTDGTQDLVRAHFADIPGRLVERPWRDFGTNRSEAVALARGNADYILVMDADHVFAAPPGYRFETLDADAYYITHRYAGVDYGIAVLLADPIAWRYEGVLHEYVTADVPHRIVPLTGPWIDVFHEGARSRDPQTYARDAAVLEAALAREPGNTRYAFYLAQSLKDAGEQRRRRARRINCSSRMPPIRGAPSMSSPSPPGMPAHATKDAAPPSVLSPNGVFRKPSASGSRGIWHGTDDAAMAAPAVDAAPRGYNDSRRFGFVTGVPCDV